MSFEGLANARPLRGDGQGHYRIRIVGNSGTGKSTLGKELAAMLGVPFIPLDELAWGPNWSMVPVEEFCSKVKCALGEAKNGWIVDGNYYKHAGPIVQAQATDVIWLDPPFLLYFPRILVRTFLRLVGLTPPCSPGCQERLSEVFFSKESIIWWCLTNHVPVRKRETENMRLDGGVEHGGLYKRIGGWGSELNAFKESVRAMIEQQHVEAA